MSVPSNWLVPLAYVTVDNAGASAGSAPLSYTGLLIGQMLATGTATAEVPVLVTSKEEAVTLFGAGSYLAFQCAMWKAINTNVPLVVIPQIDNAGGNAASGNITLTGTATEGGVLAAYVNGTKYAVSVLAGDTAAEVGTALAALINGDTDAIVASSSAVAGDVVVDSNHKGEEGNYIDVRVNYYPEDKTPAGITVAITAMTGGTLNPDITNAIVAMGDTWYQVVGNSYTDSTNVGLFEAEMTSRWDVLRGIGGEGVHAVSKALLSDYTTYLSTRNNAFNTTVVAHKVCGSTLGVTAEAAAIISKYGQEDPAAPFQFKLLNTLPSAPADEFVSEDRNILLNAGAATLVRTESGRLAIEYMRTTYVKTDAGADDISYRDVNTILTLILLGYDVKNLFLKYDDFKLANDGASYPGNQNIMTPSLASSLLVALNADWVQRGLVEDTTAFKDGLVVQRDLPANPNKLIIYITPDLMNQFRLADVTNRFIL